MTTVILQQIISPYGDIEESVVIFPEELIAVSTNEELKADSLKEGRRGRINFRTHGKQSFLSVL